jgi:hypothetical protein
VPMWIHGSFLYSYWIILVIRLRNTKAAPAFRPDGITLIDVGYPRPVERGCGASPSRPYHDLSRLGEAPC